MGAPRDRAPQGFPLRGAAGRDSPTGAASRRTAVTRSPGEGVGGSVQ